MKHDIPMNHGLEEDVFEGRKHYGFKPGTIRWTKRKYNKRARRAWRKREGV